MSPATVAPPARRDEEAARPAAAPRRRSLACNLLLPVGMTPYPAVFDVTPPARFDRLQLALRVVISVLLGLVNISLGWIFLVLYFALPATAAILVAGKGPATYLDRYGPTLTRALRWLLSFQAYMIFLTDRFPLPGKDEESLIRYEVRPLGTPTPGSALGRLLTSIPEVVALLVVGIAGCIAYVVSFFTVLFAGTVPAPILALQRGLLRWQARLLAYHASLVDVAPPFAVEGDSETPTLAR